MKHLGRQCGVEAYIPPQRLVEVADERTSGILQFFLRTGQPWWHLGSLVHSAYLQGVRDTLRAIEHLGATE